MACVHKTKQNPVTNDIRRSKNDIIYPINLLIRFFPQILKFLVCTESQKLEMEI